MSLLPTLIDTLPSMEESVSEDEADSARVGEWVDLFQIHLGNLANEHQRQYTAALKSSAQPDPRVVNPVPEQALSQFSSGVVDGGGSGSDELEELSRV